MNKPQADETLHHYHIRSQKRWRAEMVYLRLMLDLTEVFARARGGHPSLLARRRQLEEMEEAGRYAGWTEA